MSRDDAATWRRSLEAFFDERGAAVGGRPTLDELCYIAGRDPRVWRRQERLDGMAEDICHHAEIGSTSSVLEVGCAAGFLAMLVAPRCRAYTGVDLAETPLAVARRLGLQNARFQKADGGALPFADATFDSVFCCDVFTNFPTAQDGMPLIRDMLRVVKAGRPVLVGNVPDKATAHELPRRVAEVAREVEAEFGPPPPSPVAMTSSPSLLDRLKGALGGTRKNPSAPPRITTYEFDRSDFEEIAQTLGARLAFGPIHPSHPYHGFRFNAVFRNDPA
ncbi:MAG: methyltransferase domain-containing protein [Gammaproteobacteria bacterium]|nr:methyltransferase domain-containing protein [Gammaproteobacteria bacterium]